METEYREPSLLNCKTGQRWLERLYRVHVKTDGWLYHALRAGSARPARGVDVGDDPSDVPTGTAATVNASVND